MQDSFKCSIAYLSSPLPFTKRNHLLHILRYMLPFPYHYRPAVAEPRIAAFLAAVKQAEA